MSPGLQGQLATYKEMAAAAEADRGRLEQEVLATAQLATALEARLRAALGGQGRGRVPRGRQRDAGVRGLRTQPPCC